MIPVLVGNILGGVGFVAIANTAQFGQEEGGELVERLREGEDFS